MGGRVGVWGQGGCERRIEVIVELQKIKSGGGVSGPAGDGGLGWGWVDREGFGWCWG